MKGIESIRSNDIESYRQWMTSFYRSGAYRECIALWVRHFVRGDGLPVRGGAGDENTATVFEDDFVVVHLRYLANSIRKKSLSGTVSTSPVSSLILPVAGGSLDFMRWTVEGDDLDRDTFTKSATVVPGAEGICGIGDVLEVLRGWHCLRLEANYGGVFVLQVSSRSSDRLVWTFDKTSGRAKFASSASIAASRDQLVCRALAEMGDVDSTSLLCEVARGHGFHFVRMEALRSLFLLSYPGLLCLLRERVLSDPHLHVRDACSKNICAMHKGVP